MRCPHCSSEDSHVIDSRSRFNSEQIRRRRECVKCKGRFTTHEVIERRYPQIVKQNRQREHFDIEKLKKGMTLALHKRPISGEITQEALNHILRRLLETGKSELSSKCLGGWVMEELRNLDHIAYVRFASVYRNFDDLNTLLNIAMELRQEFPPSKRPQQLDILDSGDDN
ncbi:MAG: transcriptional regulator NrdR [Candidatus Eutrophobiaceae bacterium]